MNQLNASIYLSLNNYQESYEFYKSHPVKPHFLKLKVIQGLSDSKIDDQKMVA
mgnify:CR=1 FL=1